MKIIATILILLCPAFLQAQIVVSGAHVYVGGNQPFISNQVITIENGEITSVSDKAPHTLTSDIKVIECKGCYVVPGIIEMHGHLPTREYKGKEVDDLLALFVTHGVTTVRSVLGGPAQLDLLERIEKEKILAPDFIMAGPGFSGGNTKSVEEAVARIEEYARQGWQLVKVYNGLTIEVYNAIIKTAKVHNMPVIGHVPMAVGLDRVLNAGQQTIEHLDGYLEGGAGEYRLLTSKELNLLAHKTRDAKVGIVPTMKVWEVILKTASLDELMQTKGLEYVSNELLENWIDGYELPIIAEVKVFLKKLLGEYDVDILVENRRKLLGAMQRAGVKIYFGTDSPQTFSVAGASVVPEMLEMQASGMSPAQVIESATVNAGSLLSPYFKVGQVKAGYEADLIILKNNPLKDLRAFEDPAGIIINGYYLSEATIRETLQSIKLRAAANYID
ncbi:amidohydrolase family protein [Glaciecola sp. MF2-115]|uniref:amidohydrolase family protein n=1 Tax=Glaciecola sp. MF2-115 TaxID=3384827 RepID=UPI0039A3B556